MTERVEAGRVVRAVIGRWWLVVIFAGVGGVVGYLTSHLLLPQTYEASTSVLVGQPLDRSFAEKDDLEASEELARVYADVVLQEPVLAETVESLRLNTTWEALRARVRAEVAQQNRRLIAVVVEAPTRDESVAIAREIPRQLALLVARADPNADPSVDPRIRGFIEGRLASVRAHIDRAQHALRILRSDVGAGLAPGIADRARVQSMELQRLIFGWYEDYSAMSRFMTRALPVDHLEVFEPPAAVLQPASSRAWLHIVQSAMLGLILGIVTAYVLAFRGRRSRPTESGSRAAGPLEA